MRETESTTLTVTGDTITGVVHLWMSKEHALCGATDPGHPECLGPDGYPIAVNAHCPNCFRPVCGDCLRIRFG